MIMGVRMGVKQRDQKQKISRNPEVSKLAVEFRTIHLIVALTVYLPV